MSEASWYPFENGGTIGQKGSEEGTILRDEEHPLGSRITLERDGSIAPFAITCGIYGCMMHTRFFSRESEANEQYDQMTVALDELLFAESDAGPEGSGSFMDKLEKFMETYP
jgi:hypothetical protein